jgi:hypothetical protein
MSTNKWKSTSIYGALNNYPLYTDATNTTLVEDASFHTDGDLTANEFVLKNVLARACLYNKNVTNSTTDYTLLIFPTGGLNLNAKDVMYIKIDNNGKITISSSNFVSLINIDAPSFTVSGVNINTIYQTIANASATYQTISSMSTYLTSTASTNASFNYLGSFGCNQFRFKDYGTLACLYHKDVVDYTTDYTLEIFPTGGLNLNAKTTMYLKIDNNGKITISSSNFLSLINIDAPSFTVSGVNINTIYQTIAGMPSLTGYLTTSSASSTYQPISAMTNYLSYDSGTSSFLTSETLTCNNFTLKKSLTSAILLNKLVSNHYTDYTLCMFGDGNLNVNANSIMYTKINDNVCSTLTSSSLTIASSIDLISTASKSEKFKPTNVLVNDLNCIGGTLQIYTPSNVTCTSGTTYTSTNLFGSDILIDSSHYPRGTYTCLVNLEIYSNTSSGDTTTITALESDVTFLVTSVPLQKYRNVDRNTYVTSTATTRLITVIQIMGIFNIYNDANITVNLTPTFTKTGTGSIYINTSSNIVLTRIG